MAEPVTKFLSLGGIADVTKNMYVYEYAGEILIVDCGLGFPEETAWGVDLVIPDIDSLKSKTRQIRGILITHGHEDHFGALPYLLPGLGFPQIWATKLTAGFIESKLKEFGLLKKTTINLIDPDADQSYQLGVFRVTAFRVNHSVPDAVGYVLDTGADRIFHVADFKFDWQDVSGKTFAIDKVVKLASRGVSLLALDCLGVNNPGYTQSEREIEINLDQIIGHTKGRVFFTTLTSNISRIQQAINVAQKYHRRVVTLGLSMKTNVKIAQKLGYLDRVPVESVNGKRARRLPAAQILFLISGSYGQPDSALTRLARNDHHQIGIEPGDTVIFSADPAPPGTKARVDMIVDALMEQGAEVHYYDLQENLYVSGHGSRGDITILLNLIRPRFLIPLGGTSRHLYAFKSLAEELRIGEKVFVLSSGDVVELSAPGAVVVKRIPLKDIYVDGNGVGDLNAAVLGERHRLGCEGTVIISVLLDSQSGQLVSEPKVKTYGVVGPNLINGLEREIQTVVSKIIVNQVPGESFKAISELIESKSTAFLSNKLQRQPLVAVLLAKV